MESLEARLEDATSAVDSKPEDAADRVSKDEASATRLPPARHLRLWGIIAVVAAITLGAYGIEHRRDQQAAFQEWTQEQAVPTVSVICSRVCKPRDVGIYIKACIVVPAVYLEGCSCAQTAGPALKAANNNTTAREFLISIHPLCATKSTNAGCIDREYTEWLMRIPVRSIRCLLEKPFRLYAPRTPAPACFCVARCCSAT